VDKKETDSTFRPQAEYTDTRIEIDRHDHHYSSPIDIAERQYRERFQPAYREEVTVTPEYRQHIVQEETIDGPSARPIYKETFHIDEETVEPARYTVHQQKAKMGYYDEDGQSQAHAYCRLRVARR
jgi:hypothetical protein